MATAVMIYHYSSWSFPELPFGSSSIIGRFGIYAVSTFYILSGFSLAIVYNSRLSSATELWNFSVKRVFRIFPLFWMAVTSYLSLRFVEFLLLGDTVEIPGTTIFLNYTLLFGFVDPAAYLTTGAWSIGNEMVFYAIFPFLFISGFSARAWVPLAFVGSLVVASYFSFSVFDNDVALAQQWSTYINPFNQLFLFLGGVTIGLFAPAISRMLPDFTIRLGLLSAAALLFLFYPVTGDLVNLVSGANRFIFSGSCFLIVIAVFLLNDSTTQYPLRFLRKLGESSYSIYLLHPILCIPLVVVARHFEAHIAYAYAVSFVLTVIFSFASYRYLEKPMMSAGKRWVR